MTVLESFMSFAERLPADRRQSVKAILSALMATCSKGNGFTTGELEELDRRVTESDPRYASPDTIAELFGKSFPA